MESFLVVARDSDINNLDPHNFKSEASYEAVENLYNGLFDLAARPGPDGSLVAQRQDVVGEIIESYRLSPDGTCLTLRVRPGVRFANGAPCTAHSVRFSLERALLGPGYLAALMDLLTVSQPEQIALLDELTLELRLARSNPMLFDLLPMQSFSVMDPTTTQEHAEPGDPWAARWYQAHALGSGPYVLSEAKPGERYVFTPNPVGWQRETLCNAGVVMRIFPEASRRFEALQRGEVDLVIGILPHQVESLGQQAHLRLLSFPTTLSKFIALDNRTPPLDDRRVRQALAYAVPYRALITGVMQGHCVPLESPIPAGMPTHDASTWAYQTDIEKAHCLLAEAGLAGGFDLPLMARGLRPDDPLVARLLEQSFAPLGVSLKTSLVDDPTFFRRLEEGYPAVLFETLSWVNDPFFHLYWHFRSGAPKNFARYSDARIDSLIQQGLFEIDAAKREGLSQEAQRILLQDSPWLFLYQPNWMVAVRANIQGYALYPDLLPRYRFLRKTAL